MLTERERRARKRLWRRRIRKLKRTKPRTWVLAGSCVGVAVFAVGVTWSVQHGDQVSAADATPRSQPSPATSPPPVDPFDLARTELAQDGAVVSILTDSTGNDPGEWPDLWAQHLGQERRVVLHQWSADDRWAKPMRYGDSGPRLAIWNHADPGAVASSVAVDVTSAVPVSPDVVIYAYGHNDTASAPIVGEDRAAEHLDAARVAIAQQWGDVPAQVVIVQNPALGKYAELGASTRRLVAEWAEGEDFPVIDVGAAFENVGPRSLTVDEYHPNAEGGRAWAGVMIEAFGQLGP